MVRKIHVNGGEIVGGPFEFCVGDGEPDYVSGVEVSWNSGANFQWVITDEGGTILGLPAKPEDVNFDGVGAGLCLIWHLSYDDGLEGLEVGNSAFTDLFGTYDFSNNIHVYRNQPEAGEISGGPFEFSVDDDKPDYVSGITLDGTASGSNSTWVITDEEGEILGLPPTLEALESVNFDEADEGVCLIWYLRYEDGLKGAKVGKNANNLKGCFDLSNPIQVIREEGDDDDDDRDVMIYPNPATDVLKIAMNQADSGKMNVAIYDFSGTNVTSVLQRTNTDKEVIFNLRTLAKGIYVLIINNGQKTFRKKVIVN